MALIGWIVFSGGGAIMLMALAVVWVLISPRSRAARVTLGGLALFYWVASLNITGETLRRVMVSPYAPVTHAPQPPGRTAIVLLGSGGFGVRDWDDGQFAVTDRIGAARLLEAARLFKLTGADYIISSGGVGVVSKRARSSGLVMADALVTLGIPRDRIVIEAKSANTWDEAVIIKEMLKSRPVEHVLLVTSQFHMRRSVGTFRAVGIDTIPAIAREPEAIEVWWGKFVPSDKALEDTGLAAHEALGIVVYWARGWYR